MPQINVYSTFVLYSWILYQCYTRKKTKQTNEKVKSESLMLSSREPNKWKSSNHQQEYNKDNAIKKKKTKRKKERKKLARKLYAPCSFKPANMLLRTKEHNPIGSYWLRGIKRKLFNSNWLILQIVKKKKVYLQYNRPFLETSIYFSSLKYTLPDIIMSQKRCQHMAGWLPGDMYIVRRAEEHLAGQAGYW